MKTRLRTLFMLWSGVLACIVSLFVTSCSDFFADNELDKKIQSAINYANAKSYKLFVKSDSAFGSFLAEGDREWKLGDTLDLQFTLNKDSYYFFGLEAISINDEKQSRSDCVQFTFNEEKSDIEKGLYIYSVKPLKEVEDIFIRPVCKLIPRVVSYTPASIQDFSYANTSIKNYIQHANGSCRNS